MFEEYLQDANEFFTRAEAAGESNEREARRNYRAAVFCTASAIEAFANYVADSFAKAETLPPQEIAFLNDRRFEFSVAKGTTVERVEFHKLEDRLKVLLKRFSTDFDFQGIAWNNLLVFKKFRDSLIHPRQVEDETLISDYRAKLRSGLAGAIEIMNCISQGIYKKPLRKQLLDLIPD